MAKERIVSMGNVVSPAVLRWSFAAGLPIFLGKWGRERRIRRGKRGKWNGAEDTSFSSAPLLSLTKSLLIWGK